eukprot:g15556.t1
MSAELLHQPSISSGSTSSPGSPTGAFTKLEVRICVHKNNVYIDHARNLHFGCRQCFSINLMLNAMLKRKTGAFVDMIRRYKYMKDLRDPQGYTPFLRAVEMDDVDTMLSLRDLYEVDTRARCNEGNSAIHIAAMFGRWNAIKKLLLKFEFKVDEQNNKGETPLKVAVNFRQDELIQILVKKLKVKVPTDLMDYINNLL